MISDELKEFFPHEIVRNEQAQLMQDMEQALKEKKTLIAHAPTGLGKTAAALTATLAQTKNTKKRIFFLTNRHTQHTIAVETLRLIATKQGRVIKTADLIGKKAMCNQEIANLFGAEFTHYCKALVENGECHYYTNVRAKKELTVEAKLAIKELTNLPPQHNQDLQEITRQKNMCSYEIATELAKDAQVVIADYNYLFNPHIRAAMLKKLGAELEDVVLIVDEAHNLPNRVTQMLSSKLSSTMLRYAILEARKFGYRGMIFWLQEMNRILTELAKFQGNEKEKLITRQAFKSMLNLVHNYDDIINEMELAAEEIRKKQKKSQLGGIVSFLENWDKEEQGYARILSEASSPQGPVFTLEHHCLDPSKITKQVFDTAHATIVMSGTLKPTFMFKDLLGITKAIEKEYASPFPRENKRTIIVPETSTKYTARSEAMFDKIANHIEELSELIPGNVACFFPSYYLRDQIMRRAKIKKPLVLEKQKMSKPEKETMLKEFAAQKQKGAILGAVTGANFAEGIDFPGKLLNGVIIIGIPLARPDLKTKEMINYYNKMFGKGWDYAYSYPAMAKCLQSAGRCIRTKTDRGAIIFLDERFTWKNYYDCIPREGLIVSKDARKHLQTFFA